MDTANWAIPNLLLCGACPQKGSFLTDNGIQLVVNLMHEKTRKLKNSIEEHKFPMDDMFVASTDLSLDDMTDALVKRLHQGTKTFIHCKGGHGRTGIVATIVLAKYHKIQEEDALKMWQSSHRSRTNFGHHGKPGNSPQFAIQYAQIHRILSRQLTNNIYFYDETGIYGKFSNFYPCEITYNGLVYPTSEHAFQAAKFEDPAYKEIIRTSNTPGMAAILGRQKVAGGFKWRLDLNQIIIKHKERGVKVRDDWENVKVNTMREILKLKFSQSDMRMVLVCTDNYNLVEHTTRDKYWGDGGDGTGENLLGKLLTEIRSC